MTSSSLTHDQALLNSLSLVRCSRSNHLVSYVGLRNESERMQLNARPVHLLWRHMLPSFRMDYTDMPGSV